MKLAAILPADRLYRLISASDNSVPFGSDILVKFVLRKTYKIKSFNDTPGNSIFNPFGESEAIRASAKNISFSPDNMYHPLCLLAAEKLQLHLQQQKEWNHNFGLSDDAEGTVIGKMFGVLVVRTSQDELGYLAAFSGKLADGNYHAKFVPPLFDGMAKGGFLTEGMIRLSRISREIDDLELLKEDGYKEKIRLLKITRKNHSISLQDKIFEQYHFLNKAGQYKSLIEIFRDASYKKPPAGAGECAAPKLLQYAFLNKMEPLALAEFWWGLSPKSASWKHGQFYSPCVEKCAPILAHMLD